MADNNKSSNSLLTAEEAECRQLFNQAFWSARLSLRGKFTFDAKYFARQLVATGGPEAYGRLPESEAVSAAALVDYAMGLLPFQQAAAKLDFKLIEQALDEALNPAATGSSHSSGQKPPTPGEVYSRKK